MKFRYFVAIVLSFALCILCSSCTKSASNDFTDSRGYLDGEPLSRSWLATSSGGEVEIVGQASDEIGHTNESETEASITVSSKYYGAPLYYLIPVRFSSKKQCKDFINTTKKGELVRITAQPHGDRFLVSGWSLEGKQVNNDLPYGGDIPCPWGEYYEKFPQGRSAEDTVKLKSFKSIAYEEERVSGQYSYQTLTSGKVCSVPVLMSITIFSDRPMREIEPDYYSFKKVEILNNQWRIR